MDCPAADGLRFEGVIVVVVVVLNVTLSVLLARTNVVNIVLSPMDSGVLVGAKAEMMRGAGLC
jgi:hypothetical protein